MGKGRRVVGGFVKGEDGGGYLYRGGVWERVWRGPVVAGLEPASLLTSLQELWRAHQISAGEEQSKMCGSPVLSYSPGRYMGSLCGYDAYNVLACF